MRRRRPAEQIRDAARQLPPEASGIVVVDCSNADWLDGGDVQDACYGEPGRLPTPTGVGVLPIGNKPRAESVARELTPLKNDPPKLRETWEHVTRDAAHRAKVAIERAHL